jgi:hypothetical protein
MPTDAIEGHPPGNRRPKRNRLAISIIGSNEMNTEEIATCGLNCLECPVYIATLTNDQELKAKTAREWGAQYSEYIGKTNLLTEDMNCEGCRSTRKRFLGCDHCPIRKCSMGRNLTTCANCPEFETCVLLNGFFTVSPQAKENLGRIRASGEF